MKREQKDSGTGPDERKRGRNHGNHVRLCCPKPANIIPVMQASDDNDVCRGEC